MNEHMTPETEALWELARGVPKARLPLGMDMPPCTTDPSAFFPEKEHDDVGRETEELVLARRICGRCYMKQECLQTALANNERHGIFGGLTSKERRALHGRPVRAKYPELEVEALSDEYMTYSEVTERFGFARGTLRSKTYRERGFLPCGKFKGVTVYRTEDVLEYERTYMEAAA